MECPCIDCITLGICKSFMSDHFGFTNLGSKCSIFAKFYGLRYLVPNSPEKTFLLNFFKPLDWEKRLDQ